MKTRTIKKVSVSCILLLLACTLVGNAMAADYPKRPVEMIIPFGEGGASDTFARKFAEIINSEMPKPIQPVNKKGGGGLVGMVYAFSQKADGYTLLEITPSHVIADVMNRGKVKLQEHFEPLARIQSDIYIVGVSKESQFQSFAELVEYGKEHEVTFAGISPGGLDDFTLRALAKATGIKIKFIPYKSGSEVKAAVLGGEVDIYLDKVVSAIGYIRDGAVRPLVILNDERITKLDEFKEVPTTKELGYDVTVGSWRGFVVKKGTPAEIKSMLIDKMKQAYDSAEYQEFAEKNLVNIRPGYLPGDEFGAFLQQEYDAFDTIAVETGFKK
jgi:tripartite-type tricarboxylate transporter receptor subunit TctC